MWLQKTFHCPRISSTEPIINRLAVVIFYYFMLELIKFNIMPRVWLQCALHFLPTWFLKETFCECKWNELRQNCTTVKPSCQSVLSQCTMVYFVHFSLDPQTAIRSKGSFFTPKVQKKSGLQNLSSTWEKNPQLLRFSRCQGGPNKVFQF